MQLVSENSMFEPHIYGLNDIFIQPVERLVEPSEGRRVNAERTNFASKADHRPQRVEHEIKQPLLPYSQSDGLPPHPYLRHSRANCQSDGPGTQHDVNILQTCAFESDFA